MKPIINFIGAGNLGTTIAKLFVLKNTATIQSVCNTSVNSGQCAVDFITQGSVCDHIKNLPPADITFITTSDDQIEHCCNLLSQSKQLQNNSMIVHCSGVLTSDILNSAKNKGCFVASVHPMKSFANATLGVVSFQNTYCALEGDKEAVAVIESLFKTIGANIYQIKADKKVTYHAAGVFASNYLVTIFQESLDCLQQAGVADAVAKNVVIDLMRSTLNNISQTDSLKEALTGPIKRGDVETVQKHVDALSDDALYRVLGLKTVDIAGLSEMVKVRLSKVLLKKKKDVA